MASQPVVKTKGRFKTISKNTHVLGRIGVNCSYSRALGTMVIGVDRAMALRFDTANQADTIVHARVQVVHINRSTTEIMMSLVQPRIRETQHKFQRMTAEHRGTTNPIFDEEYQFEMRSIGNTMDEYRVYIVVLAAHVTNPMAVRLIGGFSFGLNELNNGPKTGTYWLLPQSKALRMSEEVFQEEVVDDLVAEPDALMAGRGASMANNMINGTYVAQAWLHNDRVVLKHRMHGMYMYYHTGKRAWVVGDSVGDSSPYAYAITEVDHPGLCQSIWWIFSKGREYTTVTAQESLTYNRGQFEQDPDVICRLVGPGADRRMRLAQYEAEREETLKRQAAEQALIAKREKDLARMEEQEKKQRNRAMVKETARQQYDQMQAKYLYESKAAKQQAVALEQQLKLVELQMSGLRQTESNRKAEVRQVRREKRERQRVQEEEEARIERERVEREEELIRQRMEEERERLERIRQEERRREEIIHKKKEEIERARERLRREREEAALERSKNQVAAPNMDKRGLVPEAHTFHLTKPLKKVEQVHVDTRL